MPTITDDSLVARAILAANRPVRREGSPASPDRMRRSDELDVWFDPQHAFRVGRGRTAFRAADDTGRFCWLIREVGGTDWLSYVKNPFDAVAADRGDSGGMRIPHPAVTELAAALRRGCWRAAGHRSAPQRG